MYYIFFHIFLGKIQILFFIIGSIILNFDFLIYLLSKFIYFVYYLFFDICYLVDIDGVLLDFH
jgi:hypothetical protein